MAAPLTASSAVRLRAYVYRPERTVTGTANREYFALTACACQASTPALDRADNSFHLTTHRFLNYRIFQNLDEIEPGAFQHADYVTSL